MVSFNEKGGRKSIITLVAILAVSSMAFADMSIKIDPDAYSEGTNISNAFTGVSLSSFGSYVNGQVYAVNPSTKNDPFHASTGRLVFGNNKSGFPHTWYQNKALLRADFSSGATDVQLDSIGNNHSDYGVMYAYDMGGSLVDSAYTGQLTLNKVETLIVSGDISYIVAAGINSVNILGLDNLQYNMVPVPGALVLGMIGLPIVGWCKRRFA